MAFQYRAHRNKWHNGWRVPPWCEQRKINAPSEIAFRNTNNTMTLPKHNFFPHAFVTGRPSAEAAAIHDELKVFFDGMGAVIGRICSAEHKIVKQYIPNLECWHVTPIPPWPSCCANSSRTRFSLPLSRSTLSWTLYTFSWFRMEFFLFPLFWLIFPDEKKINPLNLIFWRFCCFLVPKQLILSVFCCLAIRLHPGAKFCCYSDWHSAVDSVSVANVLDSASVSISILEQRYMVQSALPETVWLCFWRKLRINWWHNT